MVFGDLHMWGMNKMLSCKMGSASSAEQQVNKKMQCFQTQMSDEMLQSESKDTLRALFFATEKA